MLGFSIALPEEVVGLVDGKPPPLGKVTKVDHYCCVVSGVGADRANMAAEALVNSGATVLVSWGTAGGLTQALTAGQLLIPESVITKENSYATDPAWRKSLQQCLPPNMRFMTGVMYCPYQVISSSLEKQKLYQATLAMAIDMESAAIARVAEKHNLPFLILRVVLDESSDNIPQSIVNSIGENGQIQLFNLLFAVLKNPLELLSLLRLSCRFRKARRTLQQIALAIRQHADIVMTQGNHSILNS